MSGQLTERTEQTELDNPIKIRWTGRARLRIKDVALDIGYNGWDDTVTDAHHARIYDALDRQKTNVVIETVEEAQALAGEMNGYRNESGRGGRVWVNGAIANACQRVQDEIVRGMEERGFVARDLDRCDMSFDPVDTDGSGDVDDDHVLCKTCSGRMDATFHWESNVNPDRKWGHFTLYRCVECGLSGSTIADTDGLIQNNVVAQGGA